MTSQENRKKFKELGGKIKAARQRKYKRAKDAVAVISCHEAISLNTYQKHESGGRKPSEKMLRAYAQVFDVPLETFLDDHLRVNKIVNNRPVKVNRQITEKSSGFSFVIPQIRHIPVFTPQEIGQYVQKGMPMSQPPERILPLPAQMDAGERAFAYEIPADDRSMVQPTMPSIAPGTICIVDPDREVRPGDFVLVSGGGGLMAVRQLQADSDYADGKPFTLIALNDMFEPTRNAQKTWKIVGRVIGLHIVM